MTTQLTSPIDKIINEIKDLASENKRLSLHLPLLLISFFLSVAISCEGDLTLFSTDQLLKMLTMMFLLVMAFQFGLMGNTQFKQKFQTRWQQELFYYFCVNASFIPLLILSRSHQGLALEIPLLTLLFSFGGLSVTYLIPLLKGHQPLKENLETLEIKASLPNEGLGKVKTVLINGMDNGIGEHLLNLLMPLKIQTLILIGRDLSTLEAWRYWLREFYPDITVVTAVSPHITEVSLKALFSSYKPNLVFDLDRVFFSTKADGGAVAVANSNLHWPRLIIDYAVKFKAKAVLTLSPEAQDLDPLVYNCQVIHEGYAQRMDSSKTRVIPLRCHPLSGDKSTFNYLTRYLKSLDYDEDFFVADSKNVAQLMINILEQLFANPSHHGSVWAVTGVKKIKAETIHRFATPDLSFQQFGTLLLDLICQKKMSIHRDSSWLDVSIPHLALVHDCTLVEADYDESLTALSEALNKKNDVEVSTILQVA